VLLRKWYNRSLATRVTTQTAVSRGKMGESIIQREHLVITFLYRNTMLLFRLHFKWYNLYEPHARDLVEESGFFICKVGYSKYDVAGPITHHF
jgi:hypothetical protein